MPKTQPRSFKPLFAALLCAVTFIGVLSLSHQFAARVRSAAATITVDTTADDNTVNGNCTLREAILAANTNAAVDACVAGGAGLDQLEFNVGVGTPTITLSAGLPSIEEPLTINGATGGATRVELNGAGVGADGLLIHAASTLRALAINRFNGNGIHLEGGGGTTIENCYIGTDASGTVDLGNGVHGIWVNTSANNTLGGTSAAQRNVIAGNGQSGVLIFNASATGNKVLGNYIGLDATGANALGNDAAGVVLDAPGVTVGGVAVGARNVISANGSGILVRTGGDGAQVLNNYVGTNAAGTAAVGTQNLGIAILSVSSNLIAGNLSSGNVRGVYVVGPASNNQIKSNYIGTDASGTTALPNNAGLFMEFGAANNQIGGTATGEGNVISGNLAYGIAFASCPNNSIQGNLIGTNAAGTAALGNGGEGIVLDNSPNVLIGGTAAGARNVIANNNGTGIWLLNCQAAAPNIQVLGNFVGADLTGMLDFGNAGNGITLTNTNNTVIGGTSSAARNVLSGNGFNGLQVEGTLASGNQVQGNYIGTNAAGTADLGNSELGILLNSGASNNLIGGPTSAARNLISGNDAYGVGIGNASNNTMQNNYIGTDVNGALALGNRFTGVIIADGANNLIGSAGAGNVISGNENGVVVLGVAATGNQVQGNYIGTNAVGSAAIPNGHGVEFKGGATNNLLGGTVSGAGNLISGNAGDFAVGIFENGTSSNLVVGNLIGTNAAGTTALGNATHGIRVDSGATNTTIGGTTPGARNVIAASGQLGIWILNSTGTQVLGNYIGTDSTGTVDLGNALNGIAITNSSGNVIGGTAAGARNVISGNDSYGISIGGAAATGNQILGNYIGTNAVDTAALGNLGSGVIIVDDAANNQIGGNAVGAANVIAFNNGAGVSLLGNGTGNSILANRILGNAGLGIDLQGDGPTSNDTDDADTGPNNLQNYPVLQPMTTAGFVFGSLDSATTNALYPVRLDFYANTACDASGNGEGEVYLGAISLTGPAALFSFSYTPVSGKTFITATATAANGNTSEFAPCVQAPTNTPPTITTVAVTRQAGSPAANATIATVNDAQTPAGSLTVTATSVPAGLTVNGISNAGGTVTANVAALCNAVVGANTVVLTVTDAQGATATANLIVTVTANTAPTLSYNDVTIPLGGTYAINPATGPADNGSVASITVQNVAPPSGPTATVNNTTGQVTLSNINRAGRYNINVQARDNCNANRTATFKVTVAASITAPLVRAVTNDFDGDGKSDLVNWQAPSGRWQIGRSSDETTQTLQFGGPGDIFVPGDYDGDGRVDVAVFRPANGAWYILKSGSAAAAQVFVKPWGGSGDTPVPGDYDGDGKTDLAVWRGATGEWFIWRSSDEKYQLERWGAAVAPYHDVPVAGDYDGDGQTDLAVFRRGVTPEQGGYWYIRLSGTGELASKHWGLGTDTPVPADYDGDGRTDIAVWRGQQSSGVWYFVQSGDGAEVAQAWGSALAPYHDVAAPGDYDGDGKTDLAVCRAATVWHILPSTTGSVLTKQIP